MRFAVSQVATFLWLSARGAVARRYSRALYNLEASLINDAEWCQKYRYHLLTGDAACLPDLNSAQHQQVPTTSSKHSKRACHALLSSTGRGFDTATEATVALFVTAQLRL